MKRTGNSKIAVVGWGRGMGHTGHMYLADAVITQAQAMKADPYFFISKTVGKDDPIYPEEKVQIYQRVFPKYANIFEPQGNLNQALTDLAGLGYEGVVVVVGADQKEAFKYLEKPNKEGTPVYQSMGLKKLKVISRQETNSKYANQEGPRATPMREILLKPEASEQDKFNVWRRDMPKALSDQEVLDLMHKAEERMKAIPTKNKKLKEFIQRIRPMLKEASVEQKIKILKLIKEATKREGSSCGPRANLTLKTYVVNVMDEATGKHRTIEIRATSPEMAKEGAQMKGYKVLRIEEKGVTEGRKPFRDLKSWVDHAKSQGLSVKKSNSSDWTHDATDKEGNVRGRFCKISNVPQNSRGFIHQQGVAEGKMDELEMDLEDSEISDSQFEKMYGMTRKEAREQFSQTDMWAFPEIRDPNKPLHESMDYLEEK